jgi:hypothetical protein
VPSATAFVDTIATNQRGDARYATGHQRRRARAERLPQHLETADRNRRRRPDRAGGGRLPGRGGSTWTGVPGDGTPDGTMLNAAVHQANIDYVVKATTNRTAEQAVQAYLDDRRGKGYSVSDGMGPLTAAWRAAAQQTTSITEVAADATTKLYNDSGNNTGVGRQRQRQLRQRGRPGQPGRQQRLDRTGQALLQIRPSIPLEQQRGGAAGAGAGQEHHPATDGGYTSGHTAEGVRDSIAMAYAVPERFQEMVSRGLELGESRILAGMHSPLDVISGRMLGTASAAANLADAANAAKKTAAVTQAHTALMAATGTTADTFAAYAQSGTRPTTALPTTPPTRPTTAPQHLRLRADRRHQRRRQRAEGRGSAAETRQPYLSDAQRRVVLKTTALASGYPVMDDAEGWGRLNLFGGRRLRQLQRQRHHRDGRQPRASTRWTAGATTSAGGKLVRKARAR